MHSMAALERMGFEVTYITTTTEGYIRPDKALNINKPGFAEYMLSLIHI